MQINGINNETIQHLANFIKHQHFLSGDYIFNQNDASKYFYGIIRGTVIIRINKKVENTDKNRAKLERENVPYVEDRIYLHYEEDILDLEEGECFGHWGLIDNATRTSSAVAKGSCDLFLVSREVFEFSFKVDF